MADQYLTINIPPGVVRNGTEYQSKGRYVDSNLMRWHQGQMRPEGGWTSYSVSTVTGAARAMLSWSDNSRSVWLAVGTHSKLYVYNQSAIRYDITPSGFLPGRVDAILGGGFGAGNFGSGTFGTVRSTSSAVQDATVLSLDTFGQNLVMVSPDDGYLYEWALGTSVPAAKIANAPSATGLVVTDEGFLMALGAAGHAKRVQWCDQRNDTVWSPTATNQAGDYDLDTDGRLLCGRKIRGGVLLFTDVDVFLAQYIPNQLVYGFTRVGERCGVVSRRAVAVLDTMAVWMGRNAFYQYSGYVQPVPCDVADYVFSNLNQLQVSKIHAVHNAQFGEVRWFFPSASSTEIDTYVTWAYRDNHWQVGKLARLSGVDAGILKNPVMVDASGQLWNHETGISWGGAMPYAKTGPIEVDDGSRVFDCNGMIADVSPLGAATVIALTRFDADDGQTTNGPYALSTLTDMLWCGRQVELLYTATGTADFRIGVQRLQIVPGGDR